MYKVAVMGDKDSVEGFKAIGMHAVVANKEDAQLKLKELVELNYAAIFITEELASGIPEVIERYKEEIIPAIILVPGLKGNTGDGMRNIGELVKKATGADILG
ncbi:MAG TPA: V-type ATP synthase subunit F [Clostridia bacterium]|jgi:V/A-type H+-transporting ATPase subunit F|nr:V-type ATP synthase subunit F [Clostridiaceae bacterium]HOA31656.1 V-type ATP synthase subunit F [Clostridia bacterium]HPZ51806.1 V-type ATP synthase subunit F [Clostridia bacterium]